MRDPGIYTITCIPTGKVYVGSSVNVPGRLRQHYSSLKKGKHYNRRLQKAWNEYGPSNFDFRFIERCNEENIRKREQQYIDTLNACKTGFNVNPRTDQKYDNHHEPLSEEHKRKISVANSGNRWALGYHHTDEAKGRISASARSRTYYPPTEDQKRRISETLKGKPGHPVSEKTKEKLRQSWAKRIEDGSYEPTRRKLSEALKGNSNAVGSKSEEVKQHMREAQRRRRDNAKK